MATTSTPSLSSLAIKNLPLATIIEQKLIGGPFEAIQEDLESRVTLDELYYENLLTSDLDSSIFYLALEKISPNWVWFYLDPTIVSLDDIPSFMPLSSQGLDRLNKNQEDTLIQVEAAVENLKMDLVMLSYHEGEYFDYSSKIGVIWDYFNGKYRLFIHQEGPISSEEEEPGLHVVQLNTFTQLISRIFRFFPQPLQFTLRPPDNLPKPEREGLRIISKQFTEELENLYDSIWNHGLAIETYSYLDLSLSFLTPPTRIQAIGEYIYFFTNDAYPVYLSQEEGNLVLMTLIYNYDRWAFVSALI